MTDSPWAERQVDLWRILDRAVSYAAQAVIDADRANESPDLGTLQPVLAAEIMVAEGATLSEAEREAWRRLGDGRHEAIVRWATARVRDYKAARARSWHERHEE